MSHERSGGRTRREHPRAAGSLERQYVVSLSLTVLALVVTGVISAGTVIWAAVSVSRTEQTVDALREANGNVLQDMTNAETGIQGYSITGLRDDLRTYELGVAYLPSDRRALREQAREHPALVRAVVAQEQAIERWFGDFAQQQLEGPAGAGSTRDFSRGSRIFDEFRAANAQVDAELDRVVQDLRRRSLLVVGVALGVVGVLPLLAVVGVTLLARRLRRSVVLPLTEIAAVLERLRAGDTTARATARGPREIRQIAEELNLLTEEHARASLVEADVQARLESIDKVRSDLVSTVSHELRTPLTSVAGYLEVLHDELDPQLSTEQRLMLAAVDRNLERLTELIGNLLTLSRAEDTALRPEPLDVRGLAAEVAADLRMHAASRDIALRTLMTAAPVVVVGDRSQLTRAIQNLVTNAVKFSLPGGVVEVRVSLEDSDALVEVVDEGIGIPAEDLSGLGARFFRASNAVRREIGGTGLGLRIVQTILERHDGRLAVESVEGEGSTFALRLPVRRAPASASGEPSPPESRDGEVPSET